ncbi:MAG: VOC family protein, partial [Ilumatobacter sp.]
MTEPVYKLHPTEARWTHVALRVEDIERTIDFYTSMTPLELLDQIASVVDQFLLGAGNHHVVLAERNARFARLAEAELHDPIGE